MPSSLFVANTDSLGKQIRTPTGAGRIDAIGATHVGTVAHRTSSAWD
jgi:hypothetical protein